jgi:hypothetical protein
MKTEEYGWLVFFSGMGVFVELFSRGLQGKALLARPRGLILWASLGLGGGLLNMKLEKYAEEKLERRRQEMIKERIQGC